MFIFNSYFKVFTKYMISSIFIFSFQIPKTSVGGGGGGGGGRKAEPLSAGGCSVGLKTSHESEMAAAAGGGGFGLKCDRGNDGLWPVNGDGDDDERLDVLLSSSLLVRRYSSFSLKYAILMYEMLGFFAIY